MVREQLPRRLQLGRKSPKEVNAKTTLYPLCQSASDQSLRDDRLCCTGRKGRGF